MASPVEGLTADSVLIPVAYYVHHRKLGHSYRESPNTREDREALRFVGPTFAHRSRRLGFRPPTHCRDLREIIKAQGSASFPLAAFEKAMALRGKSLAVTDALIDDVLSLEYGKARTFAVLATLFPHVDTRNVVHVDHVYPAALLDRKKLTALLADDGTAKFTPEQIEEFIALRDTLPNLALLPPLAIRN